MKIWLAQHMHRLDYQTKAVLHVITGGEPNTEARKLLIHYSTLLYIFSF